MRPARALGLAASLLLACSQQVVDSKGPPAKQSDPTPPDPGVEAHGPEDLSRAVGAWVKLAPGRFLMSRGTDACRGPNEREHEVTLTRRFELMTTEVTQAMYTEVMGFNPSHDTACGGDCPAESVSWHLAAAYANALSERTVATPCYACSGAGASLRCTEAAPFSGAQILSCPGYRLPTEAEWEYAYRAGAETTLYNGPLGVCAGLDPTLAKDAWYRATSDDRIHRAAGKAPNAWGLSDMSGNVWEWAEDWFASDLGAAPVVDPVGTIVGPTRVTRGGSYHCEASEVRGGHRSALPTTVAGNNVGFRVARSL